MKVIIIAAGMSKRLRPLTEHKPKCMLEVKGKTILQRQLEIFRDLGINDISLIKGYKKEAIDYKGIKYYTNDNYENNNILGSLFYAEKEMGQEFIVTYSDILFDRSVVEKLLECKSEIGVIVDEEWKGSYEGRTLHPLEEAEKVIISKGKVVNIGKLLDMDLSLVSGEFIGMAKFSEAGAKILVGEYHKAKELFANKPFQKAALFEKAYLTDMLQHLVNNNHKVSPVLIKGKWREIDTPQDLEKVGDEEWIA